MRRPTVTLIMAVVLVLVAGVVAAGAAGGDSEPTWEQVQAAQEQLTWQRPTDYPDWTGLTTGGPAATEDAQPAATIVSSIDTVEDPCGDATSGEADIDNVVIELQDDGHWRFTVNLCAAHDLRDETGWMFSFDTVATPNSTTPTDVNPWRTYYAMLTHEVEYTIFQIFPNPPIPVYEPDAATYFDDSWTIFTFTFGRPDGDTMSCPGSGGPLFGDPDRGYTPSVDAATAFSVDIDPACFGQPGHLWFGINAPGDSIVISDDMDNASVYANRPVTGRISGASRFETAVAISRRAFPLGSAWDQYTLPLAQMNGATDVVYLVDAFNFPDALAGGSLMALAQPDLAGPLLYWNSIAGTVPDSTLGEICRIQPGQIIALGGTGAVSDAALAAAKTAAASNDCFTDYGVPR